MENTGTPCLPGVEFVGKSFDITTDSTDPDRLASLLRPNIPQMNFGTDPPRKTIAGKQYIVPSDLKVNAYNSASTSSISHNYKDINSFKQDRAAALNIKGSYGLKSGSAAIKGGDSIKTSLQNNKQFTEFTNLSYQGTGSARKYWSL